jgi:hypothetical protein
MHIGERDFARFGFSLKNVRELFSDVAPLFLRKTRILATLDFDVCPPFLRRRVYPVLAPSFISEER